jgi:hypothetical protein
VSGDACGSECAFCGRCEAGERPNATCHDCGIAFSRAAADVGTLCDACCDQRDAWVSALELRLQLRAVA